MGHPAGAYEFGVLGFLAVYVVCEWYFRRAGLALAAFGLLCYMGWMNPTEWLTVAQSWHAWNVQWLFGGAVAVTLLARVVFGLMLDIGKLRGQGRTSKSSATPSRPFERK